MAELPEIMILSQQMDQELKSKELEYAELIQEKCLNMEKDNFIADVTGKKVLKVYPRGKWIFMRLSEGYHLLLNLGMGADLLYYEKGAKWPEEYQCRFHFKDQSGLTCRFWWMGRVELVPDNDLVLENIFST